MRVWTAQFWREGMMLTGPICKAARSLVQVTRTKLANNAGVSRDVIEHFERGIGSPDANTVTALKDALEDLGAVFIPESGSNGAGVRLKFSRSVTDRLQHLVNEGGPSGKDAIP